MQTEILMIGTELLLGDVVDTNAAFLGKTLAEHGVNLFQKTTVGDNLDRMCTALRTALSRADVVLTSGGLGPTEDDLTRECIAQVTGRPLEFREDGYETLKAKFASFRYPMPPNNKKQAYAPQGATFIDNPIGTAPGLLVETGGKYIMAMPGVPKELKMMTHDHVIPFLRKTYKFADVIRSRTLLVCAIGESRVDDAIGDLIVEADNPKIGLLASPRAVRIRITAKAESDETAFALIDSMADKVYERLPGLVMGENDDTLEAVVDALLVKRGWRIAVCETHTGGLIAQRLTSANASSFAGGVVELGSAKIGDCSQISPTADIAVAFNGLSPEALRCHFNADCALVLTAETNDCTRIRFTSPEHEKTWSLDYAGTDERRQTRAAVAALEFVRRLLSEDTHGHD